jgi:hypothetical protein
LPTIGILFLKLWPKMPRLPYLVFTKILAKLLSLFEKQSGLLLGTIIV